MHLVISDPFTTVNNNFVRSFYKMPSKITLTKYVAIRERWGTRNLAFKGQKEFEVFGVSAKSFQTVEF